MKLQRMRKIPDDDRGTEFHSVSYFAYHSSEFQFWCEANCVGEWGFEKDSVHTHVVGDLGLYHAWLYDDQDAMLFKLTFT